MKHGLKLFRVQRFPRLEQVPCWGYTPPRRPIWWTSLLVTMLAARKWTTVDDIWYKMIQSPTTFNIQIYSIYTNCFNHYILFHISIILLYMFTFATFAIKAIISWCSISHRHHEANNMTFSFTHTAHIPKQNTLAKCTQMHPGSPSASEVSSGQSSEPRPQAWIWKTSVFDLSKKRIET